MTIEQAKRLYEELREKYEAKLASYNVFYESEIYLEDEEFEKVTHLDKGGFVSLDVNIFTDNIKKEDGICFCASATVTNDRVDDDEILEDNKEFESSIEEFIDKLSLADSADELIKCESEKIDAKVDEMMREFESKMKKSTTAVTVAVAICVVCAAVALLVHFLA